MPDRCKKQDRKPENQVPTLKGSNIRPLQGRENSSRCRPDP